MKVAAVIGHSMESPGLYSVPLHSSEYMYNLEVASYLYPFDVYKRPSGDGYTTQMEKLADILNPKNYDLVIELHFNGYNKKAQGCQTVSYPGNAFTKELGNDYCKRISKKYNIHNRGARELEEGGRGWEFLARMNAPAMILEPFFGDQEDCVKFENEAIYADLIKDWLKCK